MTYSRNSQADNGSKPDRAQVLEPSDSQPVSEVSPTPEGIWSHSTRDLLDALPQVWTRGLLYFLIVCAGVVLPWSMLSRVDETGTARGRLEPKGKTIRLDAPVSGTVSAIKVKEGQTVTAGAPLVELETEMIRSELEQAQARLEGLRNRYNQLQLMQNQLGSSLNTQRLQNQAQAAAQLAQINQTKQQLKLSESTTVLIEELRVKDQQRVDRFSQLRDQGIIPGIQVEDAERNLIESQQRLAKAQSEIEQGRSELAKQQSSQQKLQREGELVLIESDRQQKELEAEMLDTQANIEQILKQIESLQFQLQQRVIRAPIAGTIFQLPVKSAGAVLPTGGMVAQIAPQNTSVVLKAQIPSENSGFLRVGLPVKVKFDAYPFQDYGVVSGQVRWISPDSKVKETPQGSYEVFDLEIVLDRPYIESGKKRIQLSPGQTATAEVIVRQRRVIDFVLDPFKKLQSGLKL
ncbi:HlyD family efflux transporter periplasmic adaptor subunit [Pseudanabaenaceae cyanobacterium LEGE 13415]|nr:HlyD family efflux transporter periplasmic adaptor subunit [Pseudanabaenaceae cyanobacterium LEGE 13415]